MQMVFSTTAVYRHVQRNVMALEQNVNQILQVIIVITAAVAIQLQRHVHVIMQVINTVLCQEL